MQYLKSLYTRIDGREEQINTVEPLQNLTPQQRLSLAELEDDIDYILSELEERMFEHRLIKARLH